MQLIADHPVGPPRCVPGITAHYLCWRRAWHDGGGGIAAWLRNHAAS
jgi:hypothetical protein